MCGSGKTNEVLVALIRSGVDEADNMLQLWQQNQNFIRKMAVRYSNHAEIDDLMQEGYIALCEAVRHYDAEQGVPFINYAAFWIKQGMQRYVVNCGNVVRIPVHAEEWAHKHKRIKTEYQKYYGSEPSDKALCALLHINSEKLCSIKKSVQMGQIRSLNEPLGDEDGGLTVGDAIESGEDMEGDVIRKLDYQSMKEMLWKAVDSLPGKEGAVIRCRYLDNRTLKEVGEIYGITGDMARTQQDKAMKGLRKPSRCQKFRGYFEEYLSAACYRHVGVESFHRTWTSEVEREAIRGL